MLINLLSFASLGAGAAAPFQLPADSGAFIVRLGHDTIAIERFVRLRRDAVIPPAFLKKLREMLLKRDDSPESYRLLCEAHKSPIASVLRAGVLRSGRPLPEIEDAIMATVEAIKPCVERRGNVDVSGFYSEDFFRRTWIQIQVTNSLAPDEFLADRLFFAIEENIEVNYRQLADGRIGVEYRLNDTYACFIVFIQQGERWVIDEWLEVTLHPGGLG